MKKTIGSFKSVALIILAFNSARLLPMRTMAADGLSPLGAGFFFLLTGMKSPLGLGLVGKRVMMPVFSFEMRVVSVFCC
jgi:hypothetical protein